MAILRLLARHRAAIGVLAVGLLVGAGGLAVAAPGRGSRPVAEQVAATVDLEGFVGIDPVRVLDTRAPSNGPIGVPAPAPLASGAQIDLPLTTPAPNRTFTVPSDAVSVLLNITVDNDASAASFITAWPTGSPRPFVSANNATPGLVTPNSILVKLGGGSVSFYNYAGEVNLAVDLAGYTVTIPAAGPEGPAGPPGPPGPPGSPAGAPGFLGTASPTAVLVGTSSTNVGEVLTAPTSNYFVSAEVGLSVEQEFSVANTVICEIVDENGSPITGLDGQSLVAELTAMAFAPHAGHLSISGVIPNLTGDVALSCTKFGTSVVNATDSFLTLIELSDQIVP